MRLTGVEDEAGHSHQHLQANYHVQELHSPQVGQYVLLSNMLVVEQRDKQELCCIAWGKECVCVCVCV